MIRLKRSAIKAMKAKSIFNDRQKKVLQNYANIHHKGNVDRAVTSLVSSGLKHEGYRGGGDGLVAMPQNDHEKLLKKKIETG